MTKRESASWSQERKDAAHAVYGTATAKATDMALLDALTRCVELASTGEHDSNRHAVSRILRELEKRHGENE